MRQTYYHLPRDDSSLHGTESQLSLWQWQAHTATADYDIGHGRDVVRGLSPRGLY